jgi:hypothetical protein
MRIMQSAADANKVLVEIKTDGKPLRFSIPAGDTYYTADSGHMMLPRPVLDPRPRHRTGSARVRRDHRSSGLRLCALAQPAECPGRAVCSNRDEAALPALYVSSRQAISAPTDTPSSIMPIAKTLGLSARRPCLRRQGHRMGGL